MGCPSSDDDETEESVKTQSSNATVPVETPRTTDCVGPSVVSVECNGRSVNTQGETTGHPPMNLTHQERRSSLPIGLLENGQINSLCGQILRYMGDEQYSLACGRHLRGMGDQLCYNYFVRNLFRRSGEFQRQNTNTLTESLSTPNLNNFKP